jgi:hypothetical protein
MPSGKFIAWTAVIALVVTVAHDRYKSGGLGAKSGGGAVRRMGA